MQDIKASLFIPINVEEAALLADGVTVVLEAISGPALRAKLEHSIRQSVDANILSTELLEDDPAPIR